MPEPIRIPLTPHQQKQLDAIDSSMELLRAQHHAVLHSLLASVGDPAAYAPPWRIERAGDAIVLTPPRDDAGVGADVDRGAVKARPVRSR